MSKIFIVVEGGCIRYVSSTSGSSTVTVIDLDDMRESLSYNDPSANEWFEDNLKEAENLRRIW